jgi:putative DNA primase/helicase
VSASVDFQPSPRPESATGKNEIQRSTSKAIASANEMLVSCVTSAKDTATRHYDPKEIIESIRADKHFTLGEPIQKIRNTFANILESSSGDRKTAKKAIADAKKRLPGVMWSGSFRERSVEKLLEHSGLLCADLDELGNRLPDVREKLLSSPHVWALFSSPTGDGLKCVCRVAADVTKHRGSFRAVEKHVHELCGIQIDKSCSDVARLCFLSHDPDAYLNEQAVELPPSVEPEQKAKEREPVADEKLQRRREIAEEVLGDVNWHSDSSGYCTCPAQHLHTSGDADRDCEVYLERVPSIHCFHQSCMAVVSGVNHELRSRIGKAEWESGDQHGRSTPGDWFNQKFPSLAEKFGDPVLIGETRDGRLYVKDISQDFVAATLDEQSRPETPTIFIPIEQKFYTYSPCDGIFLNQREANLLADLSRLLLNCAEDCNTGSIDISALKFRLRDSKKLTGVLKKAQAILATPDDFFATGLTEFIPCANGMLRLSDRQLLPFSPMYRRRNKLAVDFKPGAKCPLFLGTLMQPALDAEDLDLLQRWCGLALIGENVAQRLLILTGTAGGGKGTFIRVLVGILGQTNVASLRTQLLNERFELGRFLGKTLLYGADVPEKFLNHRGASVLKSLTGGDPVALEFKRSNESPVVVCKFNAIVTCNSRLTVHLEGDSDAWRRRLVIIKYEKPQPENVIADLSEQILKNESSGILNWQLDGLEKVRADGWQLRLTPAQQTRVDDLLLESEGHIIFARDALYVADGSDLTVEDCYAAYVRFCTERGWIILPRNKFSNLIGDAVARMHGLPVRHDIANAPFQPQQRGWRGLEVGSVLEGD